MLSIYLLLNFWNLGCTISKLSCSQESIGGPCFFTSTQTLVFTLWSWRRLYLADKNNAYSLVCKQFDTKMVRINKISTQSMIRLIVSNVMEHDNACTRFQANFERNTFLKCFKNILLYERHSSQLKSKSIQPEKLYSKYLHNEIFHRLTASKRPNPRPKQSTNHSHRALNDEI
jgi:hypothetical protein